MSLSWLIFCHTAAWLFDWMLWLIVIFFHWLLDWIVWFVPGIQFYSHGRKEKPLFSRRSQPHSCTFSRLWVIHSKIREERQRTWQKYSQMDKVSFSYWLPYWVTYLTIPKLGKRVCKSTQRKSEVHITHNLKLSCTSGCSGKDPKAWLSRTQISAIKHWSWPTEKTLSTLKRLIGGSVISRNETD